MCKTKINDFHIKCVICEKKHAVWFDICAVKKKTIKIKIKMMKMMKLVFIFINTHNLKINYVFKIKKQNPFSWNWNAKLIMRFKIFWKKTKNQSVSQSNQLIILINSKYKKFANTMTTKKSKKHFVKNFS